MVLFVDVEGDLNRIANLHRLGEVEIGSLSPKIVNYEGIIVCSKNAFEYIQSFAPDKRCYELVGSKLEIHVPRKIMLNFIAEEKMPEVWTRDNFVPTVWYDPEINDFGYLFTDYLADGIILREIKFKGTLTQKQLALANKQLESFCTCFFAIGPEIGVYNVDGDIGFKIRTFGSGTDLTFDSRFFGFGSAYLDFTRLILLRLTKYANRAADVDRDEIFNEIMSEVNSQQVYDIKL